MKLTRSKTIGLCLAGLIAALLVSVLILPNEYPTEQTATRSFVIDEDFTKVRKIMVRTDAAKEIVTMGGDSEFIDQHWEDVSAGAAGKDLGEALLRNVLSSDPDWELKLHGTLEVRTLGNYVGRNEVTLEQDVEIEPDFLQSNTKLIKGSERLLDYAMTTRLEREDDHTKVELTLTQTIKTNAPWFAHGIADRRVRESAEQTLAHQEAAMRRLIAENRDKNWLFPLR